MSDEIDWLHVDRMIEASVNAKVKREVQRAIHAERKHIATALRTVADRFGGPVKAALEQVAREVGGT